MKRSVFRSPAILLLFLFAAGCASLTPVRREEPAEIPGPEMQKREPLAEKESLPEPDKPAAEVPVREIPPDPFKDLPDKYRLRARELEQKNDWPGALFCWEIVNGFLPDDPEAVRSLQEAREAVRTQSENHLRRGLDHLRNEKAAAARKEFLIALAYQPDDTQTLNYVRPRILEEDYIFYVSKKDDTPKSVARQVYGDESKEFLVAYFNDLKAGEPIRSDTVLKMPRIQAALTPKRGASSEEMVNKARSSLRARNYEEAVSYAEKALEYAPSQREAKEVKNAAYYQWGTEFLQKKEDWNALRMFKKADENYKNVKEIVGRLEMRLQKQKGTAEDHYLKGVKHFLAEELNEAAREWETTLTLDPQHSRARRDLERVRRLQGRDPQAP
jgi:tetratricopeptide (TPR) repeat protein